MYNKKILSENQKSRPRRDFQNSIFENYTAPSTILVSSSASAEEAD